MPKSAFPNYFSEREHLKAFPFHQMAGSTDYITKSVLFLSNNRGQD
jgi:hypothetical protein